MIVQPDYISFQDWARSLIMDLEADLPAPPDEARWSEWAMEVIKQTDDLSAMPDPSIFGSWREWALYVYQQLS